MQEETIDGNNSYAAGIEPIVIQSKSEDDATFRTTTQEQLPPPQQQQQPQSVVLLPMSDYSVPPELQIPLIVLIALVGFVVILVLSSVSVPKPKVTPSKKVDENDNVPGTPSRKSTRSSSEVTGSIVTPMGRRSARLRAKHD